MNDDGKDSVSGIFVCFLLVVATTFASVIGWHGGRESHRNLAVSVGAAKWVPDEKGRPEFAWAVENVESEDSLNQ